jgi:Na+-transporting methylmalonyl-CoA/oxaloacetate decarboxylase gamma subunit
MINSPVDELNTGLAFQDIFRSDSQISEDNNLLVVNSGNTIIRLVYPYLMEGIIVTAIGVILCMIFLIYCMTSEIRDREKKEETDSEDETEEQPEPDNEGDEAVSEKENAGKETASDELQKHKYDLKSFDIDLTSGDDFDIPFGHKGKNKFQAQWETGF